MITSTEPAVDLAEGLLLARLLASAAKPPAPGKVFDDVGRLFGEPPGRGWWDDLTAELRAAGWIEPRAMRLTDAGRERALRFLGVDRLPPRANWGTVRSRYLVPMALGANPASGEARDRLSKKDGLAATVVKRRYDLASGRTLSQAAEALVCKELGFPDVGSLADLKAVVLSRLLGADRTLTREQIEAQLPRKASGARTGTVEALREAVLRDWTAGRARDGGVIDEPAAVAESEMSLREFADTVKAAARSCPTGWFEDYKVLINHVWQQLEGEPGFAGLSLESFKRRLLEANSRNMIVLERADMPQYMDARDIAESEIRHLVATFHYIRIERSR